MVGHQGIYSLGLVPRVHARNRTFYSMDPRHKAGGIAGGIKGICDDF